MIQIRNIINQLPTKNKFILALRPTTMGIVIHHSGVEANTQGDIVQNLQSIANWCIRRKWYHQGLPYHYVIDREGNIYYCVDDKKFLPHCNNLKYNWKSISVCLIGHGDNTTDIQLSRTAQLVGYLRGKHKKKLEVKGHRDFVATYCPSDKVYGQMNNFNSVLGANTIMEAPYKAGDLISITTGAGIRLNVRDTHSTSGKIIKKLKKGDRVKALGGVQSADGHTWIDTDFGEGLGWLVSKWTKLYKKAEVSQAEDAKYHAHEIKKHADSIINLSK